MHFVRKLLREIHRRSIWQVLGVYLAGSWGVLQAVDSLTKFAGLPEWTPTFALVLILAGLPIVTATAFIQKGMPALRGEYQDEVPPEELVGLTPDDVHIDPERHPLHRERVFTWRNAILGGVGAAGLLVAAVVAYLAMWATGIGPVGSLVAQGVIDDGGAVILADFTNSTTDSTLGGVVTAALRADLVQSPVIRLVERSALEDVLVRMQRDPGTRLTPEVAREAAQRDGIRAVVEGEVGSVGSGYILTATIRAAGSGDALGAFRVSAAGPDDLIRAIDKLSRDIREKAGESLRNIRAGKPLDEVTTASLDALRLYSQAEDMFDRGDYAGTISLLRQAVETDSTFAMAWRFLSVAYGNTGLDPEKEAEAATEAYRHRDHLTEVERYLTVALYASTVTGDRAAAREAYRNALRADPDNPQALNNLGGLYQDTDELDKAVDLYRRAVSGRGVSTVAFQNLAQALLAQGKPDSALAVTDAYRARYPADDFALMVRAFALLRLRRFDEASAAADSVATAADASADDRSLAYRTLALVAIRRGRLDEADRARSQSVRVAARSGPAFEWSAANDAAWQDVLLGRASEGAGMLKAWIRDGRLDSLPPLARLHETAAETFVVAGDLDEARALLRDFRASVPSARINAELAEDIRVDEAMIRARGTDTVGVADSVQAVRDDAMCTSCYRVELALAQEWMHHPARAVELWESILARPDTYADATPLQQSAAMVRLGPLYEAVGDTTKAVAAYRRVLEWWGEGDAGAATYLRKARGRLAALGAAGG